MEILAIKNENIAYKSIIIKERQQMMQADQSNLYICPYQYIGLKRKAKNGVVDKNIKLSPLCLQFSYVYMYILLPVVCFRHYYLYCFV